MIYRIGLDEVVAALQGGRFSNPDWVQTFDVAFAKRYLDNLHRHLREQQATPPWYQAYRRADVQTASVTTILAAALNAHLITDLPEALHVSGVRYKHAVDYHTLSGLIWATAPNAITAIMTPTKQTYHRCITPHRLSGRSAPSAGARRPPPNDNCSTQSALSPSAKPWQWPIHSSGR